MLGAFVAKIGASGDGGGRGVLRDAARQLSRIELLHGHVRFAARQLQKLVDQMPRTLNRRIDFHQALLQGMRIALSHGQIELSLQTCQRGAQLMRRIVHEALFLAHAALHGRQQLIDRTGQRMHFLRSLLQSNRQKWRSRVRIGARLRLQLRLQARQRLQTARNSRIHQRAEHQAQQQERNQHVLHQLSGNPLAHRQTFGHLHPQSLRRACLAKLQFHGGNPQRTGLPVLGIHHGLIQLDIGVLLQERHHGGGRLGQCRIAQNKLPRRAGDHVAHLVLRIFLDDGLRGARKVNQQT